ncbi:MAG TPA: AAA family ATPase, partial [Fermentimonas sp.]|nr:AAA family ATPase [Fermentimonas sp.]
HLSDKESYVLEFENESFGTQRYFEFIGLMCELIHKNRIVSIDEIESSMHIDLQLHFIETFLRNSRKGQLIFTSHNTALLNEREILRRDAIWITDRKPDGSTSLTSVSEYPVRKEHAIDRLYRKGYLGGIPSLGSTLLENADENYEKKE